MRYSSLLTTATIITSVLCQHIKPRDEETDVKTSSGSQFQPKVLIISMFGLERDPWLESMDLIQNITIPGLSPMYPTIHCTTNGTICQITIDEGEINAAASMTALTLSPLFDLSKTYFLIAGIAGGEPQYTTLGGVTFARFAVQVGLAYQFGYDDYIKEHPDWTTGYIPFGVSDQDSYPESVFGTEVFEVNEKLRDRAVELAQKVNLNKGNELNAQFRQLYTEEVARAEPAIYKCDVSTSDNYFTGNILNDYAANFTKLMTNGTATYCATALEDNATLEVLTRLSKSGLVDFDRVMIMRSIANFARPPPSMSALDFFFNGTTGGIEASLDNLVIAGTPIIHDILTNWETDYKNGNKYASNNYIGDVYGTLGGTPDFGFDSYIEF
ncbi:uncharacterized protein J8A68_002427 [[Candida] subhashii]|uniref:Purine nucleoside permease n=1 Tax=[Candida] subhashii TaxID=561895 RepID=A0A8J5QD85_9ASCO|nr:uncharacterized protein J8A68_002427 [[Candida] subhashii]KAG7664049.1 hypothetical protein J8A68_002427 [[Candida] subhashii]